MGIYRLIYVSQSRANLDYPDLFDIMEKSERNNKAVGITGLLCYGDGWFLQALEGHRSAVSQTYNRIIGDSRHFNAELLDFSEIDTRQFLDWSMKAIQFGLEQRERRAILRYSNTDRFSPISMNAQQCFDLMLELSELHGENAPSRSLEL